MTVCLMWQVSLAVRDGFLLMRKGTDLGFSVISLVALHFLDRPNHAHRFELGHHQDLLHLRFHLLLRRAFRLVLYSRDQVSPLKSPSSRCCVASFAEHLSCPVSSSCAIGDCRSSTSTDCSTAPSEPVLGTSTRTTCPPSTRPVWTRTSPSSSTWRTPPSKSWPPSRSRPDRSTWPGRHSSPQHTLAFFILSSFLWVNLGRQRLPCHRLGSPNGLYGLVCRCNGYGFLTQSIVLGRTRGEFGEKG